MKLDRVKNVANAVLYEGYLLYPYRPSSIKNRQRWTFGSLFPKPFAGHQGDPSSMQTQLLLRCGTKSALDVHIRFLQVLTREVGSLPRAVAELTPEVEAEAVMVPRLEIDGKEYLAWEEAIEREVAIADLALPDIVAQPRQRPFHFQATRTSEPVKNSKGEVSGLLIRSSCSIDGIIQIFAESLTEGVYRLTVRVENVTELSMAERGERGLAQRRAFASTHAILGLHDGAFLSLMDPPAELSDAAAACDNQGAWPVLVGEPGETNSILSSPIILYDYPDVAPESPGDLYDATEIDEILTLRILTMTDAEKREMVSADARARALLERTHGLTAAELAQMHGVMRPAGSTRAAQDLLSGGSGRDGAPRLASLLSRGRALTVGAEVRLRPKAGGDIMDLALAGQVAVIEAIERDFEDRVHIAVTLRDDPGRDLGAAGFPGHRFFFSQDEIEPVGLGEPT